MLQGWTTCLWLLFFLYLHQLCFVEHLITHMVVLLNLHAALRSMLMCLETNALLNAMRVTSFLIVQMDYLLVAAPHFGRVLWWHAMVRNYCFHRKKKLKEFNILTAFLFEVSLQKYFKLNIIIMLTFSKQAIWTLLHLTIDLLPSMTSFHIAVDAYVNGRTNVLDRVKFMKYSSFKANCPNILSCILYCWQTARFLHMLLCINVT